MLRHLSTGTATLAILMAAARHNGPPARTAPATPDVRVLLAELGGRTLSQPPTIQSAPPAEAS